MIRESRNFRTKMADKKSKLDYTIACKPSFSYKILEIVEQVDT